MKPSMLQAVGKEVAGLVECGLRDSDFSENPL